MRRTTTTKFPCADQKKLQQTTVALEAEKNEQFGDIGKEEMDAVEEKLAATNFKLSKVLGELREQDHSRKDRMKLDTRTKLLLAMKQKFNDNRTPDKVRVHGVVQDLCKPRRDRQAAAVAACIGSSNLGMVIVEDRKTILECVAWLKQYNHNPLTFMPLNGGKYKRSNERVNKVCEEKCGQAAIDCVEFLPKYKVVFEHLLTDKVVVDTEVEAQELWDYASSKEKLLIQCVTKDATIVRKNGNLTFDPEARRLSDKFGEAEREANIEDLKMVGLGREFRFYLYSS